MNDRNKNPRYNTTSRFPVPLSFMSENFHSPIEFSPEKRDVIITSYPACGANWVSHIVHLILRKGQPCTSADEYFHSIPFLEMAGLEELKYAAKPRCIKSHLPLDRIKQVYEAKYIYVFRHPRDLVVPLYNLTKSLPVYLFSDGSFDKFLDLFCKDELPYGDYYDHVSTGYSGRLRPNVLLITYDEIKKDLRSAILKIADFIKEFYYVKYLTTIGGKDLKDMLYCCSLEYLETMEAEYYSIDENYEEIILSEEHTKKLDDYINKKTYGDYFSLFHDWRPS